MVQLLTGSLACTESALHGPFLPLLAPATGAAGSGAWRASRCSGRAGFGRRGEADVEHRRARGSRPRLLASVPPLSAPSHVRAVGPAGGLPGDPLLAAELPGGGDRPAPGDPDRTARGSERR